MSLLREELSSVIQQLNSSDSYFLYDYRFTLMMMKITKNVESFELLLKKQNDYTLFYPIRILHGSTNRYDSLSIKYPHNNIEKSFSFPNKISLLHWFTDLILFTPMIYSIKPNK